MLVSSEINLFKLDNAILKLLTEAKVLTGDLGGNATTNDVSKEIITEAINYGK